MKDKDKKKDKISNADNRAAKPASADDKEKVANDKAKIGDILRPEAKSTDNVKVGKANDPAEAAADKVAEEITSKSDENIKKDDEETADAPLATSRGPPTNFIQPSPLAVRRVEDKNGDQPNLDELANVPSLDGNLVEVGVGADEEADFDDLAGSDMGTLAAGENSVMMKAMPDATAPEYVPASLLGRLHNPSQGRALPAHISARFEQRFGLDLSDVQVHLDDEASFLARAMGARAFAFGNHIWLKNPQDFGNDFLIAHEAAHCIQQGAAKALVTSNTPNKANECCEAPSQTQNKWQTKWQRPQARGPPALAGSASHIRCLSDGEEPGLLASQAEDLADGLDSYKLLKVLIGKRLFTGQTVPQTAMDYCEAFMTFIGADETFEQMKESGSIERGFSAIRDGAEKHDLTFSRVQRLFGTLMDEIEWTSPIQSFTRVFSPFFRDIVSFGALVLKTIAELVAEAFVIGFGPMGREVWDKIKAIGDVIELVLENPLRFVMNLIRAVSQGIEGFGTRIWSHIKKGLLAWLLGPLVEMGITLPEKLDVSGIISVVLQVLGLTYPQLRERIVAKLNPRGDFKVTVVERIVEVINILRTEGLAGLWRKFLDYIQNLQMTMINAVKDWAIRAIVEAGIRKIVAWSNPAGALIDMLFTIYKLIVFFVENFQRILDFASSIFESIGKIAEGKLTEAAAYVEDTLAKTIPIILSFMTRLLGLPDISGTIKGLIKNLRARVHAAFDKILDFVIKKVKKLIAKLISKFKRENGEPENAVNLQGTTHQMKFKQEGSRRRLYIYSEETEVTSDLVKANKNGTDKFMSDPNKTIMSNAEQAQITILEASERREEQEARKPESNNSAPTKEDERNKTVTDLIPEMEKAAECVGNEPGPDDNKEQEEANNAPDSDALQENESIENDKKEIVVSDSNNVAMRFIVVPKNYPIEGGWAQWPTVKADRVALKTHLASKGLEGRYSVDLDHNPEYQILWRLGHAKYADNEREEGENVSEKGFLFPGIAEMYGKQDLNSGNSRDHKDSDKDYVMAVRHEAHLALPNTQTNLKDKFMGELFEKSEGKKAFVPKPDVDINTLKGEFAGMEAAANEHHAELVEAYNAMVEEDYVHIETKEHIQTEGPKMIKATMDTFNSEQLVAISGGPAPGNRSGIRMDPDPISAEFLMAEYGKLDGEIKNYASDRTKSVFEKHHLIEKSRLQNVKDRFSQVDIGSVLAEGGEPISSGGQIAGMKNDAKNKLKTLKDNGSLPANLDIESELVSIFDEAGLPSLTVFNTDNINTKGNAIAVLRHVNGILSAQPEANVDTAITAHLSQKIQTLSTGLKSDLTTAMSSLDNMTPESQEGAGTGVLESVRNTVHSAWKNQVNGFERELKTSLVAVLDQLTENAQTALVTVADQSFNQMNPREKNFEEGTPAKEAYDQMTTNYEAGPKNLENLKTANRHWAA